MFFSVILSIILLVLATIFYLFSKSSILRILVFFVLFLISLLLNIFYYISNYFTGEGVTEATLYHLVYGLQGSGWQDYLGIILFLYLMFLVIIFLFIFLSIKFYKKQGRYFYLALLLMLISIFCSLQSVRAYEFFIKDKIDNNEVVLESEIYKNYNNEEIKKDFHYFYNESRIKKTGESKNLVLIYLEGLEQTYSNEVLFPGLVPNLNKLEKKSLIFSDIRQPYGTGYTIAGIVASQCGIPLLSPSHGNSMFGMDKFLPGATCLGDLLKKEGYYLSYLGGASLDFAGKGKFLQTHGFDKILGREYLINELKEGEKSEAWGLYDDALFRLAYEEFLRLYETKDKFVLSFLTLDTHHPKGRTSDECEKKYPDNKMLDAVKCTDKLLGDFLDKILVYDDVVVVLLSDHLALNNTATEILEKGRRTNRFIVLSNSVSPTVVNRTGNVFDIAPTILNFIGFDGDIGLGTSLLKKDYNAKDKSYIYTMIKSWKDNINVFFDFPKVTDSIKLFLEKEIVEIEGREFNIPIFIELDSKLQTKLKFDVDITKAESLIQNIIEDDPQESFVLFDKCENIARLLPNEYFGYCIMVGNKGRYQFLGKITSDIEIGKDFLERLINN